jgi:hypothetical protein
MRYSLLPFEKSRDHLEREKDTMDSIRNTSTRRDTPTGSSRDASTRSRPFDVTRQSTIRSTGFLEESRSTQPSRSSSRDVDRFSMLSSGVRSVPVRDVGGQEGSTRRTLRQDTTDTAGQGGSIERYHLLGSRRQQEPSIVSSERYPLRQQGDTIGKSSLQRAYSMDLTKSTGQRPLDLSRSFDPVKKGKFQQQETLKEEMTVKYQEDMQYIKGKGIIIEEDKKEIYKMPDEKIQMSSDQGKSENQGRTVREKRDDELNRESKQLVLEFDHLMDSIKKQAQFLTKAEKAIWESNELTLEQKRKNTHLLGMSNKEYVEKLQPTGQYLIERLDTVANEQAITNHLKEKSEGNGK